MAALNGGNESRLVDDLSTRNINNDSARIEQRDFPGTNETIGSGDGRRRVNERVGDRKRVVESIRPDHPLDEWRRRLFQATADAGYANPERVSPPRDFLADGAQAKDGHLSALQTPGPSITRQLVLNP